VVVLDIDSAAAVRRDPNIVGRQLRLNDQVRTVIGVMPKRFMCARPTSTFQSLSSAGAWSMALRRSSAWTIEPGVTEAHAEVDLRRSSRT